MNRIVVTKYYNQIIAVFIKEDNAVKIRAFNSIDEIYGAVYLGRVKNVKKNISSAFVSYNNGRIGFISKKNIKPETVLPIMLKKQTSGNKEDVVTDVITLSGLYCVVGNAVKGINKSKKLSEFNTEGYNFNNVIIRSNAINTSVESVHREYEYLSKLLSDINDIADKRTDNSILYKGIPSIINTIFSENISEYDEILTDISEVFELIKSFVNEYTDRNIDVPILVRMYEDSLVPLNALISLSGKMDRALNRKVYLKSDAFLVIDYTEAMTVIDVNSGTTRFKGDKDDVIRDINLEAAREIVLQLKLRNLSGIIVVDFINVKKKEYNDELLTLLNSELKNDDCHARCHGMTHLGLVEITRDRVSLPLREQIIDE